MKEKQIIINRLLYIGIFLFLLAGFSACIKTPDKTKSFNDNTYYEQSISMFVRYNDNVTDTLDFKIKYEKPNPKIFFHPYLDYTSLYTKNSFGTKYKVASDVKSFSIITDKHIKVILYQSEKY